MIVSTNVPPHGYTTIQGQKSTTFKPPPLDGTLYIPEMIDWHLNHSEQHPFAVLVGEGNLENVFISWGELCRAVHRQAAMYQSAITEGLADASGRPRTVGILASRDSLTYCTIVLALMRAGLQPFPISPRNSAPAIESLLRATDTIYLVGSVGEDVNSLSVLDETTRSIVSTLPTLVLLPVPRAGDLFPRLSSEPIKPYDAQDDARATALLAPVRTFASYKNADWDWPCIMLHSSGTTGFPRASALRQKFVLTWGCTYWYGDVDVCEAVWGVMAMPLFHAVGTLCLIATPMASGCVSALFSVSTFPTPENSLAAVVKTNTRYLFATPAFCEEWSMDHNSIEALAGLERLLYVGGTLPQQAGDRLVRGGVKLQSAYGSTETGTIFKLIQGRLFDGPDWQYAEFSPELKHRRVTEGEGLYSFVLEETDSHALAVFNVDGEKAFKVNDLLEEHPHYPGYWRVIGRADDKIVTSDSQKTNPAPIESIIASNPAIRAAIMFGSGRPHTGVIVEPVAPMATENGVEELREAIWSDVERANALAQSASRIFQEMILVADPVSRPFIRTPKGTIVREASLTLYRAEIDKAYEDFERPLHEHWAKPPSSWGNEEIKEFAMRVVNNVLHGTSAAIDEVTIKSNVNLFQQGCDREKARRIQRVFVHALNHASQPYETIAHLSGTSVQQNLVQAYPTVDALAGYMYAFTHQGPGSGGGSDSV